MKRQKSGSGNAFGLQSAIPEPGLSIARTLSLRLACGVMVRSLPASGVGDKTTEASAETTPHCSGVGKSPTLTLRSGRCGAWYVEHATDVVQFWRRAQRRGGGR